MLYRLVQFVAPRQIIEFGTGFGISTAWLASANNNIPVNTIEADTERIIFAQKQLSGPDFRNVQFLNIQFDDFLEQNMEVKCPVLIFIDGNHNYTSTMKYFNHFLAKVDEDSVIVFDDIRWSGEMERAWKKIIENPAVKVSIDLFFMGMVFFKTGVPKQHFVVNF